MLNEILRELENSRDDIIELQTKMTALPALDPTSGGDGELEKAKYIATILDEIGLEYEYYNAPDDRVSCGYRPNIISKIKGKSDKTLWVMGHMDVVPVGDLSLWKTDPWKVEVNGDLVIGRGVEDNQQAIATMLILARAIKKYNLVPEYNLGLIFASDEETGNEYGIKYLLKNHLDLFDKDDFSIAPDFGVSAGNEVCVSEKSRLWLKLTVLGEQCHAARPHLGRNTFVGASYMVVALQEKLAAKYNKQDELFVPPCSTFTPTKHEANVPNVNTVPAKDVFYVDCRVLPDYDLQEIVDTVKGICEEIANERELRVELECLEFLSAAPKADLSTDFGKKFCAAIEKIHNLPAIEIGSGGGTFAGYMREYGLNAVAWATIVATYHEPNECSNIKFTIADAKIIASILFNE